MIIEKLLHDRFHEIAIKRLLETKRKVKNG